MSFQRTSEIAGGGLAYNPGSTYFPLTDYMSKASFTHAANVHTVFGIIQADPFVTATQAYRSVFRSVHSSNTIGSMNLQATDAATAPAGAQMFGRDSAGGVMFDIRCSDVLVDGNKHWFFFAYNAATADYIFIVDGKNATIASETANTGTQSSGASAAFGIGSNDAGTASVDYQGEISFFGYDDSYRENWYDFFESDGTPKEIDTAGWTEWGAQPLIFSPHADMRNNLGSLTAFAINGTGMRAGDMMNNAIPYRGLGTIGDISRGQVPDGRVGWANAQRYAGQAVLPILHYDFSGPANNIQAGNHIPRYSIDDTTVIVPHDTTVDTDGNGYLVEGASGARGFNITSTLWPTRTGVRHCVLRGRWTGNPTATSYSPTIRANWQDGSNFWACRLYQNAGSSRRLEIYEWNGGVGTNVQGGMATMSGAYEWILHVEDHGDRLIAHALAWPTAAPASTRTNTQMQSVEVYVANRPLKAVDNRYQILWEGSREKAEFSELLIYDTPL